MEEMEELFIGRRWRYEKLNFIFSEKKSSSRGLESESPTRNVFPRKFRRFFRIRIRFCGQYR